MIEKYKDDSWVDSYAICRLFGLKYDTLKKQRTRKVGLPFHKFGRSVRYNILEIKNWLQENKRGNNEQR
jgi:hypothetical protein